MFYLLLRNRYFSKSCIMLVISKLIKDLLSEINVTSALMLFDSSKVKTFDYFLRWIAADCGDALMSCWWMS